MHSVERSGGPGTGYCYVVVPGTAVAVQSPSHPSRSLRHEPIIRQLRIPSHHSIDLLRLSAVTAASCGSRHHVPRSSPWRRSTSWMPGMQPAKRVGRVEDGGVRVGERGAVAQQRRVHGAGRRVRRARGRAARTARVRPHRPLAEQPADDATRCAVAADRREGRQQVGDDAVVVAGVEREVVAPRVGHGAHDVERPIAVERARS